jgi:hypothetical protein
MRLPATIAASDRDRWLGQFSRAVPGHFWRAAKMILVQVMETSANALFNGYGRQSLKLLKRNVRIPGSAIVEALLQALSSLVGRDEAQHVAFGMRVLRASFEGVTPSARHVIEQQVQNASELMVTACAEVGKSYRRLGFGEREVLERIELAQRRYWNHLDIDPQGRRSGAHCG